jgi:hypothetical protein
MKKRLKLARVQVPPRALLSMIVDRATGAALGATEPNALLVLNPNAHAAFGNLQLNTRHVKRRADAEDLCVKLGVFHAPRLHRRAQLFPETHAIPG